MVEIAAVASVVAVAAAAADSLVALVLYRFVDCLDSDLVDGSRSDEDFELLVLDLSDGRDFASLDR